MGKWMCAALALAMIGATAAARTPSGGAAAAWLQTWGASPGPARPSAAINPFAVTPSFENQTLVQEMRLTAGGRRLRVRISNEYGPSPLTIGAARIAVLGPGGEAVGEGSKPLTFSGLPSAAVPAGAPLISDPVDLPTKPLSKVRIALYLPDAVHLCTCHATGGQKVRVSPPGDYTTRAFDPEPGDASYRAFVTGIEVEAPRGPVIVTLGDSITDGYRASVDADRRWPDRLAERLHAASPARNVAVVNAGISGNRVLADGALVFMGQNALARFDRDVLSVPGASHLIVLEGVNDIGAAGVRPPSPEALQAGFSQIIARAHAHGLKVFGATILPYEGAAYFHPEGETVRAALNAWIRSAGAFDGVVDFDAVMRDPARPTRLRADLQSGDWLHPNDAGYRVMGDAIDLKLFAAKPQ